MSDKITPRNNRKIKRWQRAFIALHALNIDWTWSNEEELLLHNNYLHEWRVPRQGTPAQWTVKYRGTTQRPELQTRRWKRP